MGFKFCFQNFFVFNLSLLSQILRNHKKNLSFVPNFTSFFKKSVFYSCDTANWTFFNHIFKVHFLLNFKEKHMSNLIHVNYDTSYLRIQTKFCVINYNFKIFLKSYHTLRLLMWHTHVTLRNCNVKTKFMSTIFKNNLLKMSYWAISKVVLTFEKQNKH